MKENPENDQAGGRRPLRWRPLAAAAVLAVIQACLTIRGRGVDGFVLWVLILFLGYWLLFLSLAWLVRRFRDHR